MQTAISNKYYHLFLILCFFFKAIAANTTIIIIIVIVTINTIIITQESVAVLTYYSYHYIGVDIEQRSPLIQTNAHRISRHPYRPNRPCGSRRTLRTWHTIISRAPWFSLLTLSVIHRMLQKFILFYSLKIVENTMYNYCLNTLILHCL